MLSSWVERCLEQAELAEDLLVLGRNPCCFYTPYSATRSALVSELREGYLQFDTKGEVVSILP